MRNIRFVFLSEIGHLECAYKPSALLYELGPSINNISEHILKLAEGECAQSENDFGPSLAEEKLSVASVVDVIRLRFQFIGTKQMLTNHWHLSRAARIFPSRLPG